MELRNFKLEYEVKLRKPKEPIKLFNQEVNGNKIQTLIYEDGTVLTTVIHPDSINVIWSNKEFIRMDHFLVIQN